MFEPSAGTGIYTSSDLNNWKAVDDATEWGDRHVFGPTGHRDPCILRGDDGGFLQYFAAADAEGRHTIGLATSADLRHWSPEAPCYVDANLPPYAPSSFGIFESPFVMRHGGLYYLFIGFSHRHYYETFVVVSADPRRFLPEHKITTLFTHAPEFIEIDGVTYMSSCGIEDPQCLNRSGLWMSRIRWLAPCM
jgi:beta-fructofuranosidase